MSRALRHGRNVARPTPPLPASVRPSPNRLPRWAPTALVALALAVAVFIVFRGALGLFFAQEDFRGLAVAKGLLPRHASLWRYVSVQTFMDVFYPLFGDRPGPYHLVSIVLHAANATMLFALLSRRLSAPAAFIASALFATHPAHFAAVYWQSARSDVLGTTFALATVALSLLQGKSRWLAVPCFAMALLSKETFLLLPVGLWLLESWRRVGATSERLRPEPLTLSLGVMSLAFGAYLLLGNAGIGVGTGPDAAYALSVGPSLFGNLLTYLGWTADVTMRPSPLRFVDARNPDVYWMGVLALAAWGVGCLSPQLRRRGWVIAGAFFLLVLAPVLALANHTYHYFLYAPLAAVSWCAAAAIDAWLRGSESRAGATIGWIVASVCLAALTWNGARLVRQMETRPMRIYPALRGDAIVSRAIVAENAINGLRRAGLPPGTDLVFVLRERIALLARVARRSGETPPPAEDIYPETNFRTALFEGYGVRALIPAVESVAFARDSISVSARTCIAVYAPDGEVETYTIAGLDSLLRTSWVTRW